MSTRRFLMIAWIVAAGLCCGGCLQLETIIELHPDGSGTVTERLALSRRLLSMAENSRDKAGVHRLLSRDAALERMKTMGKNIRLAKHETRESPEGGRESVAVYKIKYLGDLIYVSPFMNASPAIKELRVHLGTRLTYQGYEHLPSDSKLKVRFTESKPRALKRGGGKQTKKPETASKTSGGAGKNFKLPPGTPEGVQAYREVAPLFADMVEGFKLRVTFKSYAPIDGVNHRYVPLRNAAAHPRTADLINFSSADLDRRGERFMDNEEVMVALLRGYRIFSDPDSSSYSHFLAANLRHRESNHSLPLLHNTTLAQFDIKPSRALFDRFLAGKSFRWGGRGSNIKAQTRPAKFSEVGWEPAK